MAILEHFFYTFLSTMTDVLPIVTIIFGFQFLVLKQKIPDQKNVLIGFVYVLFGLVLFLVGLEESLFPLGKLMAIQLTDPAFIQSESHHEVLTWLDYYWVYLFGATLGFACAIAEPSVIAVAMKANAVSGGAVSVWGLRIAVAIGSAIGISLGTFRIVTGGPLHYYIIAGYVIIMLQTLFTPRMIIGLAYDSGGVTTSTVTVPLVAALGIGLASTISGRNAFLDGFGLIAFACMFPIMSVMLYAKYVDIRTQRLRWQQARAREKLQYLSQNDE